MNNQDKNMEQKKEKQQQKLKENFRKLLLVLGGLVLLFVVFRGFFPARFTPALRMSGRYAKEMFIIFPAILLIMGLADVWLPAPLVKKYLGQGSGLKGKLLAIFLGTLPTGPMYVAFPLAAELLRKKASLSNIIVFLGVWASLKIPQIGVEIQFLGLKFSALRFVFTLISVLLIGQIIEKAVKREEILTDSFEG